MRWGKYVILFVWYEQTLSKLKVFPSQDCARRNECRVLCSMCTIKQNENNKDITKKDDD